MPRSSNRAFAGRETPSLGRTRSAGFTYVMVLIAIVVIGILAGAANTLNSHLVRADREAELLFRGQAYRDAIQRYRAVSGRYPRSLDDLVADPRFAHRRYLRALYPDPMTHGPWRVVRAADGGIAGVASRSREKPIKRTDFPRGLESFEQATSYAEWIFEYAPGPARASPQVLPVNAMPR